MVNDSNIITIDSIESKMKVNKFSGNHSQETREEKNLYNVNDYSDKSTKASVDDDDWITLQLGSAQSVQIYLNYLINCSEKLKTSSTYYLVIEIKEFSGTGNLVVSQYLGSDKSQISTPISLNFSSLTTGIQKYTVSTVDDFTDINYMIRTFASFPIGSFGKIVFRLSLLEEEPDLNTFVYQKYGASPSLDYPSEVEAVGDNGSVEIKKLTENVIDLSKSVALYNTEITEIDKENGIIKVHRTNTQVPSIEINCNLPAGQYSLLHNSHNFGQISLKYGTNKERVEDIGSEKYKTFYAEKGITKLVIYSGSELPTDYEINFSDIILVMGNVAREDIKYVKYQESSYILDIQKPMLEGDYFVKEADGWKEVHGFNKKIFDGTENIGLTNNQGSFSFLVSDIPIDTNTAKIPQLFSNCYEACSWEDRNGNNKPNTISYYHQTIGFDKGNLTTVDEFKQLLSQKNAEGNSVYVYYPVATPTKLPCTDEQITVLNQLQNIILYDDTTNIILPDVYPILDYDVSKIIDTTTTFEASLDSNGYFVVPDYDIKCLVSYSESDIPSMPEAVETAVSVPGRDGDIPLNTTYNPIPFNIVCYTEDNLTPEEKYAEETKMNKFLNSIKNNTIKLKLESKGKYYDVKYNGQLTTINYPKHLQFSIPLKSSSSYAKDIDEYYILGNGEKESDTIKEVGAVFVIEGPAQTPKISLNDYEMFYDNVLLSNTKLVIDSNKSTVTMINREGTATNAMRYYNHEFPKIQNGNNVLKVLSGIDEDRQVNVRWFDLKL